MNEQVKQMYAGKISEIRNVISQMINTMREENPFSRQYSLAITDLQRAFHTLGESKGALGLESPYKQSYDQNSPVIEPTDDYVSAVFVSINDLMTQVEVVKAIRMKLKIFMKNLEEIEKDCNSEDGKAFLEEVRKARMWIRESKNWMGWELRSLEIQYQYQNGDKVPPGATESRAKPIKPLPEGMKLLDLDKAAQAVAQSPISFGTVQENPDAGAKPLPYMGEELPRAEIKDANQDIEKLVDALAEKITNEEKYPDRSNLAQGLGNEAL